MTLFILGLIIFLGMHSVRIVADGWRTRMRERLGDRRWKIVFSLISLAGLVLLLIGGREVRSDYRIWIWVPPSHIGDLTSLLSFVAFILLAAAYVPRNSIKARLHHPLTIAVLLWALGHLLASGSLDGLILFGAFLLWSVACLIAAIARDKREGTVYEPGGMRGNVLSILIGLVAGVVFAYWLHYLLTSIAPMII